MTRRTRNDLGLALLIGSLVAASPLTPDEWARAIPLGALVALAVLGYRRWSRRRGEDSPATEPVPPLIPFAPPPVSVWLVLVLFGAVFAPTLAWLYESWTVSVWRNAHGIFVPFVMGYLGHSVLKHDPEPREESSAWGFPFVLAGLGCLVLDSAIRLKYLSAFGLVLCLPGLSLLLLGVRRTKALRVPLLVGLAMLPLPDTVGGHLYLRNLTAVGVEPLLRLLDYPAFRDNTLIMTASTSFMIGEACSGLATLYAAVATAIVLAAHSTSIARRTTLLLAAFPLAWLSNVLRTVALIILTDRFGPRLLDTPVHEASGVGSFFLVIAALFLIANPKHLRGLAS